MTFEGHDKGLLTPGRQVCNVMTKYDLQDFKYACQHRMADIISFELFCMRTNGTFVLSSARVTPALATRDTARPSISSRTRSPRPSAKPATGTATPRTIRARSSFSKEDSTSFRSSRIGHNCPLSSLATLANDDTISYIFKKLQIYQITYCNVMPKLADGSQHTPYRVNKFLYLFLPTPNLSESRYHLAASQADLSSAKKSIISHPNATSQRL